MQPSNYLAEALRVHWPDIHPGMYVEWRERASDPWERVFVNTVIHEHDGQRVYTIVMVALLDGHGRHTQGMRTANGADIAMLIRPAR